MEDAGIKCNYTANAVMKVWPSMIIGIRVILSIFSYYAPADIGHAKEIHV